MGSNLGNTGKWVFIPVTACVGIVGAHMLFTSLPAFLKFVLVSSDTVIRPHGVASIFAQEPGAEELLRWPGTIQVPVAAILATLTHLEHGILAFCGICSIGAMICPFPILAKSLYYISIVYALNWVAVHIGIFFAHKNRELLDFVPEFRDSGDIQSIFGELQWPQSFWYAYCIGAIQSIIPMYYYMDLYYSWFLILTVGGSGWENMRARDLPGWEAYAAKTQKKKTNWEDDEEDVVAEGGTETNLEQLLGLVQNINVVTQM